MRVRWIVLLAAVVVGVVLVLVLRGARYQPRLLVPTRPEEERTRWVDLYFPSVAGGLALEPRELREEASINREALSVLQELFRGPLRPGAVALVPSATRVESFFVDENGTAYVGIDSTVISDSPGGTSSETLFLEAVLRTIAVNVEGVRKLQLLVDGQVRETLWGHVRLDKPLVLAMVSSGGNL
jgi:hypothetical protein